MKPTFKRERMIHCIKFITLIVLVLSSCSKQEVPIENTKYTLEISAGIGGSVSTTGGKFEEGSTVSVSAIPNSEYLFAGWSNGATTNPLNITVNENISITANFIKKKYALTIDVVGEGTVTEEILSSGKEYNSGTVIKLTANPAQGWEFKQWTGAISSYDESIELSLDAAKSLTAEFQVIDDQNALNVVSYIFKNIDPNAGIWPPGSQNLLGLASKYSRSNKTAEEFYNQMQELYNQIDVHIEEELEIFSNLRNWSNELNSSELESKQVYLKFQDSLGVASAIHELILTKRNQLIQISSEAPTISGINLEQVNRYIGHVGEINGLTNDAAYTIYLLVQLMKRTNDEFEISNSNEIQSIYDEFSNIDQQLETILFTPREDLLRNHIYTNGIDVVLQNLGLLTFEQLSFEEKVAQFDYYTELSSQEVDRFKGFYQQALQIDQNSDDLAEGMVHVFNTNYTKTKASAAKIGPEAAYRYSVQNALKRYTLFRYTEAKYFLWYEKPYENTLEGLKARKADLIGIREENERLAPQFGKVETASTGVDWEGYDSVFNPLFFRNSRITEYDANIANLEQQILDLGGGHDSGGSHDSGGDSHDSGGSDTGGN